MKQKPFILVLLLGTLFLGGCFAPKVRFYPTESERDFIQSVWQEATVFNVKNGEEADLAWNRAHVFLAQYGTKIRMVGPFTVETVVPDKLILPQIPRAFQRYVPMYYAVTRLQNAEQDEFFVHAYSSFAPDTAELNAKLLARYMQTGQLQAELISRNMEFDLHRILDSSQK